MTRPLAYFTCNKVALLLLLCAMILGGTFIFNRSYLHSAPHAAEISSIGHLRELPPLW